MPATRNFLCLLWVFPVLMFSCKNSEQRVLDELKTIGDTQATTLEKPISAEENREEEQTEDYLSEEQIEDTLAQIRNIYARIMSEMGDSTYSKKVLEYNCPDYPQKGEISYYFDSARLKYINCTYTEGGHGSGSLELFLKKGGGLVFAYETQSFWSFNHSDASNEQSTKGSFIQNRYYFNNGRLIRHLYKDFEVLDAEKFDSIDQSTPNEMIQPTSNTNSRLFGKYKKLRMWRNSANGTCVWE